MATYNKTFSVKAEEELRIFLSDEEKITIMVRHHK